jgi:hypothetical protein
MPWGAPPERIKGVPGGQSRHVGSSDCPPVLLRCAPLQAVKNILFLRQSVFGLKDIKGKNMVEKVKTLKEIIGTMALAVYGTAFALDVTRSVHLSSKHASTVPRPVPLMPYHSSTVPRSTTGAGGFMTHPKLAKIKETSQKVTLQNKLLAKLSKGWVRPFCVCTRAYVCLCHT